MERNIAEVLVILKESPFNTVRSSEALRMGLGLTLTDNRVALLFIGEGLYSLAPLQPEKIQRPRVEEFFKYLRQLSVPLLADSQGLEERGLREIREGVTMISHEEALRRIAGTKVVIPF